jgi:hypothetical protein
LRAKGSNATVAKEKLSAWDTRAPNVSVVFPVEKKGIVANITGSKKIKATKNEIRVNLWIGCLTNKKGAASKISTINPTMIMEFSP